MEDQSVDVRLQRITEIEMPDADRKRIVIAMEIRTETRYTPNLSSKLGFTDGGVSSSVDESTFVVAGDDVEDVEIREGTVSLEAEFLIPATALPVFLDVKLDGGGCSAITGCQEGRFIFDP
jgi:acyl-coenzyme A thioesterase PaaI-like protein